jgi:hypothetical protein
LFKTVSVLRTPAWSRALLHLHGRSGVDVDIVGRLRRLDAAALRGRGLRGDVSLRFAGLLRFGGVIAGDGGVVARHLRLIGGGFAGRGGFERLALASQQRRLRADLTGLRLGLRGAVLLQRAEDAEAAGNGSG